MESLRQMLTLLSNKTGKDNMQNNYLRISFFLFYITAFFSLKAQTNFSFEEICSIGLPVVSISTVNGEEPTCDFISHPEGSMGESITNATKVPCRITITDKNKTVIYDSGEYEKNVSGAIIKINGNTSAYRDNKPYKLKLEVKDDLLNRGDGKYKDKEWRLLKDARTLNTMIGLKMNELIGLPWTPAYMPCNVMINDDYRGCYLLIESVKRNSDCRLDVDKETGFIIERDPYWWNETTFFPTDYFSTSNAYRWTWKYPDQDKLTEEQTLSVQTFMNQVEKSIKDGDYDQYIDVNTFAAWLLAHDILGTWDSGGSNLFVMRHDDHALLQMANMWDFDTSFTMDANSFSRYHTGTSDFYFPLLLSNSNPAFLHAYKSKWEDIKDLIPQQIIDFVKSFGESEEGKALQISREYYDKRWRQRLPTIEENINSLIEWFTNHIPYLDATIQNIPEETNYISQIYNPTPAVIYDLQGRPVLAPKKNRIYIIDGKKVLVQ